MHLSVVFSYFCKGAPFWICVGIQFTITEPGPAQRYERDVFFFGVRSVNVLGCASLLSNMVFGGTLCNLAIEL